MNNSVLSLYNFTYALTNDSMHLLPVLNNMYVAHDSLQHIINDQ